VEHDKSKQETATILLTVNAQSYGLSVVNLAVDMAVSLQSNLHGLFIEDEDLVSMAEFPLTREISFPSGRERPTTSQSMQRSLKVVGDKFKRSLAEAATKSRIKWSYDYVQGNNRETGLDYQHSNTITIIGQAGNLPPQIFRARRPHKILILDDRSPQFSQALHVIMTRLENEAVEFVIARNPEHTSRPSNTGEKNLVHRFKNATLTEFDYSQLQNSDRSTDEFDYVIASRKELTKSLRNMITRLQCSLVLSS